MTIAELLDALQHNHELRTTLGNLIWESILGAASTNQAFQTALQNAVRPIVPANALTTDNFGPAFYNNGLVYERIKETAYEADVQAIHDTGK